MRQKATPGKVAVVISSAALIATGWPAVVGVVYPIPPTSLVDSLGAVVLPTEPPGSANQLLPNQISGTSYKSGPVVRPGDIWRVIKPAREILPQHMMFSSKAGPVVQPKPMMGSSKSLTIVPAPTLAALPGTPAVTGTPVIPSQIVPGQPLVVGAIEPNKILSTSKSGAIVFPSTVVTLMSPNVSKETPASIFPPAPPISSHQSMTESELGTIHQRTLIESPKSSLDTPPAMFVPSMGVTMVTEIIVPNQITPGQMPVESGSLIDACRSVGIREWSRFIPIIQTSTPTRTAASALPPEPFTAQQPVLPPQEMVPPNMMVRTESRMMTGSKSSMIVEPKSMYQVLTVQLARPATRPTTQPSNP